MKEILDPKPVGELVCTEEELDGHLKQTYGDILVVFPRELQNQMSHLLTPQWYLDSWKESEAVVKKARSKSAPGNNIISLNVVYKTT